MEKKLGVVTLEQLGQPPTHPNRPRRTPEPTPDGGEPPQGSANQPGSHLRQEPPNRPGPGAKTPG